MTPTMLSRVKTLAAFQALAAPEGVYGTTHDDARSLIEQLTGMRPSGPVQARRTLDEYLVDLRVDSASRRLTSAAVTGEHSSAIVDAGQALRDAREMTRFGDLQRAQELLVLVEELLDLAESTPD